MMIINIKGIITSFPRIKLIEYNSLTNVHKCFSECLTYIKFYNIFWYIFLIPYQA